MKRLLLILSIFCFLGVGNAQASLFDLDSVAAKGKFWKFCVDTYRWGDRFFNGYDSTYVAGTGYKFNAKIRTESWTDYYNLRFDNGTEMSMISDPSTSLGFYLTYLAVSAGYDMNVSKYFGGPKQARKRWNFQFNCMLFAANLYFINNNVGTRISTIDPPTGDKVHPHLEFPAINNTQWGIDLVYFITHKHYSQAAAFNFSRIQKRSAGSFFAGLSFFHQQYLFDFSKLHDGYNALLPPGVANRMYEVNTNNWYLKMGYGYNWVFRKNWVLGVSVAPSLGFTHGYHAGDANPSDYDIAGDNFGYNGEYYASNSKTRLTAFANMKLSMVYSHDRWYAGIIASGQAAFVRNAENSILSAILNFELSVGFRFNLW